jgi:serine/threonine protein kinase
MYLLYITKQSHVEFRSQLFPHRSQVANTFWPHSMIELLQRVVAWLMNRVRVNLLQPGVRDGVPVFVKRRRAGGSIVIWFGNRFLGLARSGIHMFVRADEWVDWEVHCSQLLYPGRPGVNVGPGHSVTIPTLSGISLRQLIHRNETVDHAFVATGRELRRVHQIQCSYYQAAWSHGDLHLDNILYDADSDRAVLIDFDTRHEFRIGQTRRHSDDLKVILLELIALPDEKWRQPATALIEEYRDASVLNELSRQLVVPRGFAKLFWYTRTNCSSIQHIEPRLQSLREIIHRVTTSTSDSSQTELCRRL